MILHKTVNIPFADKLISYTREQFNHLDNLPLYVKSIPVPDIIRQEINDYLALKKVSPLLGILGFRRRNSHISMDSCHIDYYNNDVVNCSVVIPVDGCENTGQIWYKGDYTPVIVHTEEYTYASIKWNSNFAIQGYRTITSPTLVRTNIPHGGYNNKSEYRTTCTIRFTGNESFEYLAEALNT